MRRSLSLLQSQGGHHHHHEDPAINVSEDHHLHEEHEENLDAMWKGLTALGGVYFMFLIEHFLTLGKMYKDKKQKVSGAPPNISTGSEDVGLNLSLLLFCGLKISKCLKTNRNSSAKSISSPFVPGGPNIWSCHGNVSTMR